MPALISIDWDFFPYNPQEAPGKLTIFPGSDHAREVDPQFFCDWSHSEVHSAGLSQLLWEVRKSHFSKCGLDLVQIFNLDPERLCTPVETFVGVLQERFRPPGDFQYADSHGMIAHKLIELRSSKNVDIVSFDAHCDLGYGNNETDQVSCENWLHAALVHLNIRTATIVYPDWKGKDEVQDSLDDSYLARYRKKITVLTWSEFVRDFKPLKRSPSHLFACRSSGWTPPWCDPLFADLLEKLPVKRRCCLDFHERKIGAFNASQPRSSEKLEFQTIPEGLW